MPKLASTEDIDAFITSSTDTNDGAVRGLVQGASGAGKTFVALSLSEFFKTDEAGLPAPCTLEDIVYFPIDPGALRGLDQFGITIPNTLHFHKLLKQCDYNLMKAEKKLLEIFYKMIDKGYRRFVFDSLSVYGQLMSTYWRPKSKDKSDNFSSLKYFSNLIYHHNRLSQALLFEPDIDILLTCHLKPVNQMVENETAAKMSAMAAGGSIDELPDLEGNGFRYYLRPLDFCLYLKTTKQKGKPATRKLTSDSVGGLVKNRFDHVIKTIEGTNLRPVFDKIRIEKKES